MAVAYCEEDEPSELALGLGGSAEPWHLGSLGQWKGKDMDLPLKTPENNSDPPQTSELPNMPQTGGSHYTFIGCC